MDFIEKFRERVSTLKELSQAENFKGCANLSTDLLRASEFAKYPEGIFIGEFFESLFLNIRSLTTKFQVEKNDIENIQKAVLPTIEFAQANIPFTIDEKKARFFDLLLDSRCIVTETQITYFREKSRKSTMPLSFPSPTIQLEEEE